MFPCVVDINRIITDLLSSTPKGKQIFSGKRKSVSFTPETKQEDGFSASRIFRSYLPPGHPRSLTQEVVVEESTEAKPESPSKSPKDETKTKKKKSKSNDQPHKDPAAQTSKSEPAKSSDDQKIPPYLQYLQLYHHDRSNWKFQSIQQKQLLKNIFNIYRIPDAYTAALANYVSGLKSLGSRILLAKQADEILQEFHNAHSGEPLKLSMESLGARKQAYQAALQRAQEQHEARGGKNSEYEENQLLEEHNARIRAERAEKILFEALNLELDPKLISAICAEPAADGTPDEPAEEEQVQNKRKRKARTHVSDDESSSSSSSSSSSESESDDSADEATEAPSKKKVKKTKPEPIFGAALLKRVFDKKNANGKSAPSSSSGESESDGESTSDESSASDNDDETSTSSASTSEESGDESS
jgi:hypothetical protein